VQDPFGRKISYLRLSVTDRCNFRCNYCMSEDMTFLPRSEVLSIEELILVSQSFIDLGVKKIRITGGEPLVRQGLMKLFNALKLKLDQGLLEEVTLTSNGVLLDKFAPLLKSAGVKRINISLDTLQANRFAKLTRKGDFDQVMKGIDAADRAGIKIKLNAVALKGVNDDEWQDMLSFCGERGFDLTFIESMPMGDIGELRAEHFMPVDEVQQQLHENWTLLPSTYKTGGPARYYDVQETGQHVGFITPYTHNFCESCNRVRLSCTGQLYLCLGQDDMVDLKPVIRKNADEAVIKQAILDGIKIKPKGHDFDAERLSDGAQVIRFMSHTGG
jgi:cyclic pyranopterin phosphate synthase